MSHKTRNKKDPLLCFYARLLRRGDYREYRGLPQFLNMMSLFETGSLVDRTEATRSALNVVPLDPIPSFRTTRRPFEELCDERAKSLLARAESMGVRLYSCFSGGVDSTLVLVSLLKNATASQKASITVLLDEDSIAENPNFYREYIRGHLAVEPAMRLPYILGGPNMIVNGEPNDQIFGTDILGKMIVRYGAEIIHAPVDRDKIRQFFVERVGEPELTGRNLDIFDRVISRAPVDIVSHADYLWWLNFSMKWQTSALRLLSSVATRNKEKIDRTYLGLKFEPFFRTEEFQLWSMNNLDKRIRDTWKSYKWVCKDIIYEFNKDSEYRKHKEKRVSVSLYLWQNIHNFIDSELRFYDDINVADYYVHDNDFE